MIYFIKVNNNKFENDWELIDKLNLGYQFDFPYSAYPFAVDSFLQHNETNLKLVWVCVIIEFVIFVPKTRSILTWWWWCWIVYDDIT